MPLFDTVLEQVEIGPATILDEGTTASTGNANYTLKGQPNEGWHLFVRPGDYVLLRGDVQDGAIVTEVVDTSTLKLSKPIAANNTEFIIVRPCEAVCRPPFGVEWELHTIVITPRIDGGISYNLHLFPVEVWSTDDNKPKTLLFTSQDYVAAESLADKPKRRFEFRIRETWITLKPTYFGWLLIRNYGLTRVDVYINGIEKTVEREEKGVAVQAEAPTE